MSNLSSVEHDGIVSRWRFEKDIMALYGGRLKKPEWSKERINVVIRLIEEFNAALETKQLRNSTHYYYAKNYDIVEEGGRKCLVQKRKDIDDHSVKIVPVEEYYDVLDEIHRNTGHGGRDKMLMALKYACFIPTPAVVAFIRSCETCQRRKAAFKKGPIFLTRAMDAFSNRGVVKLINMHLTPDESYEWILHYQDSTTKFSFLRPLTSNDAADVACELLKIFLEVGCPAILQVVNSREYTADVIKELASLWPNCKILNGRPVPEPTNPSTEQIENIYVQLTAWMQDNSSCNWAKGLYFVQFQKNCTYHPCIQKTPYKALFGCDPKVGMQFKCHGDLLNKFSLEEDLECELNRKSGNDIQHLLIETSSSAVQEVQYPNLLSNVCVLLPESNNEVPAVLLEQSVQIKTEYETTGNETMHDIATELNIKSEDKDTTTDEPMNAPAQYITYDLTAPSPEPFMRQSSSTEKQILCAVCGDKTVPTHSCGFCHRIIHDTCGISSLDSPILKCPKCYIDSVNIIKTEDGDKTGDKTMLDVSSITTEMDIKSEGEDAASDEPMNELTPGASMRQISSTNEPILCAVCGDKTVPTHSCDSCHRIIHETCGITSLESPSLLCPTCPKDSLEKTKKRVDLRTSEINTIEDEDVILIESPQVIRQPEITDWKITAPAINLQRHLKANKNRLEEPKLLRVKRFGYSTVRCRCKEWANQCSGSRCLCQKKNQACTTNCHNPLKCKNLLKVISK